jgi:hypothetical protein
MERKTTRREFLKQSLSAGAGLLFLRSWGREQSPNDKLNIAAIGVGGRGWDNLRGVASENIVALCDVDLNNLANAAKVFPDARLWTDYRRMLDRQKDIDAVVISTPDHTHALPMMRALQMGKHVYCEKPLVHSPWEARQVREAARKAKVATQMGNQAHSSEPLRIAVEVLRSRRHRHGARGACVERPPDLAAGHRATRRYQACAAVPVLGLVAGTCA